MIASWLEYMWVYREQGAPLVMMGDDNVDAMTT